MIDFIKKEIERRGLASYTKGDLEALLFYGLVFHTNLFGTDLKPAALDNNTILNIGRRFRLSITQTKNLITRSVRLYAEQQASQSVADVRQILISHLHDNPESFKSGKVEFIITNPIERNKIEEAILLANGFADTSFNKDIMVIPLSSLIRLLGKNEQTIKNKFINELKTIQQGNPALKIEQALSAEDIKTVFLKLLMENGISALSGLFTPIFSAFLNLK